jgi:hypothetical protein
VAVLHKACGVSYVAGAPRYKHRGAVFELQKKGEEATFVLGLEGEQVLAGEILLLSDWGSGCPRGEPWAQPGQSSSSWYNSVTLQSAGWS